MALTWKNPVVIAALGVLVCGAVGFSAAVSHYRLRLEKEPIYPADGRLLNSVPSETKSWKRRGEDRRENPEVEQTLGTQNYISREYVQKAPGADGRQLSVQFHAAYYTGMIDTVPHVPDRCFVGGGMALGNVIGDLPFPLDQTNWGTIQPSPLPDSVKGYAVTMRSKDGLYVRLPREPGAIRLRTMQFLDQQGGGLYAGYFFVANGGAVSSAEDVRLLAFDLKTKYSYYLKLQFTSNTVVSGEELARVSASLLDELFPEVMLCVPDWGEVESGRYPPPPATAGGG